MKKVSRLNWHQASGRVKKRPPRERWPLRPGQRPALSSPAQGAYNSFGTWEPPPTAKR